MPPEEMWGNDEALSRWFDEVRIRHGAPDKPGMERVPEAPMNQNEFIDDDWLKALRE